MRTSAALTALVFCVQSISAWRAVGIEEVQKGGPPQGSNETQVKDFEGLSAHELTSEGLDRYWAKDFHGSLVLFDRAIGLSPQDADLHAYKALALFKSGHSEAAIEGFKTAISFGGQAMHFNNLASVLFEENRYEEAAVYFRKALELSPQERVFKNNLRMTDRIVQILEIGSAVDGEKPVTILTDTFRGLKYEHDTEVAFRGLLIGKPDFNKKCLKELREAVEAELDEYGVAMAAAEHTLADMLYSLSEMEGGNTTLLNEAEQILRRSIFTPAMSACSDGDSERAAGDSVRSYGVGPYSRLHVVAVASEEKPELARLQMSAKATGVGPITVLGMGRPWEGLGSKITLLLEFLEDKPADDLVLFIDAYDVLLLPHAAYLLQLMRTAAPFQKSAVVFSGEVVSSPDHSLKLIYPPGAKDAPLPYLNSGSYVGYVGAVRWMLRDIQKDIRLHHTRHGASPHGLDDQRWFQRFYLRYHQSLPIAIDSQGLAFQTLHNVKASDMLLIDVAQGGLWSNLTKTVPLLIHGNGNGVELFYDLSASLRGIGWPEGKVVRR